MTTLMSQDRLAKVKLQDVLRRRDVDAQEAETDRGWYLVAGMMLITVGLSVSVFTNFNVMFQGVLAEMERAAGVSFGTSLDAGLVTATITLLCWVTWYVCFHWGPRMRTSWRGFLSYVAAVLFTGVTLIASSLMNFQGLTHTITRPMYMIDETNRAAAIVDQLTVATGSAKSVIPTLIAYRDDACALASAETEQGLASGTGRGHGPAASAFTSTCAGLGGLIGALQSGVADGERRTAELSRILEKQLSEADDRTIPLLEREDNFKRALARLDSVMRTYRNTGLGKAVEAGVATLQNLVARIGETGEVPAGARIAVNGLKTKLEGASRELGKVLASQGDLSGYERSRKLSLTWISLSYALQFPSQIAMAAFLDVWPLAIYSFGLLYGIGRARRRSAPIGFEDTLKLERSIPEELLKTDIRKAAKADA